MAKSPPEKLARALRANLKRRKQPPPPGPAEPQAPAGADSAADAPQKPPENSA